MRQVKLLEVEIKNFKSYLNEKIDLTGSPGLLYLGGSNQLEPDLGSNGAGKSTLWDAIRWCLYGSIGKKSTISSLVTWGQETTEVSLLVEIDGVGALFTRSGPPVKLYLNAQQVEQTAFDTLLGLSKSKFESSVIFGQAQPLFPDRTIPERGELLDEVLGLSIWQKASEAASQKSSEVEKKLLVKQSELSYLTGQLNSLPTSEELKSRIDQWENNRVASMQSLLAAVDQWKMAHESRLSELREISANWQDNQQRRIEVLRQEEANQKESWLAEIDSLTQELAGEEQKLKLLESAGVDSEKQRQTTEMRLSAIRLAIQVLDQENRDLLNLLSTKLAEVKSLTSAKEWWEQHSTTCPTCQQAVDPQFRNNKQFEILDNLNRLEAEIKQIKADQLEKSIALQASRLEGSQLIARQATEHSKINSRVNQSRELLSKIAGIRQNALTLLNKVDNPQNEWTRKIVEIENEINPNTNLIARIEAEVNPNLALVEEKKKEPNPHLQTLLDTAEKKKKLTSDLAAKNQEITDLNDYKASVDYWKHGFKNIRLFFTEKVLAALQLEVTNAMSTLGLQGWKVQLSTETETKSGTLKLGVQIQVASPKSNGFVLWESWSGGETQRLRIAIALGLASLIQRASGVVYSFETFDEPSAWLSVEGIEDLLTVLEYRAQSLQKRLWLVDHSALTYSGFSEMWQVTKDQNGSHLKKVSGEG